MYFFEGTIELGKNIPITRTIKRNLDKELKKNLIPYNNVLLSHEKVEEIRVCFKMLENEYIKFELR